MNTSNEMEIVAYTVDDNDVDIQPGTRRRKWMDNSPDQFAYRCIPLSVANMHGWEMITPEPFEVSWDGSMGTDGVQITSCNESSNSQETWIGDVHVSSHFGQGIVTLQSHTIFRTPQEYNLWVTGPPNFFIDGIHPLSALVETDWMPYTFTMNWKITRESKTITFEEGDPYCFVFPVRRGVVEETNPKIKSVDENTKIENQHTIANRKRNFLDHVQEIKGCPVDKVKNARKHKYQGWYARGENPDGNKKFDDHQNSLSVSPFRKHSSSS